MVNGKWLMVNDKWGGFSGEVLAIKESLANNLISIHVCFE